MRLIVRIGTDPTPQNLPLAVIPLVAWDRAPIWARFLSYMWALPTSAVAFPFVMANGVSGGQTILWHGVIEIQGPLVRYFLSRSFVRASAMTLGHVILCCDNDCRNRFRAHELVHVQQAERWGPMFLPFYLGMMAWTWRRTGQGYWFHPWEIEARELSRI